jgi:hypothetical protein
MAMKNERQERIFLYLLMNYPQNHFDCLYVCHKDFREGVDAYDSPAGTNLVNSARLIDLSIELQKLTPSSTRTQVSQTNFQSAIERLDAIDWAFLRDSLKDYSAAKDKKQSDSLWKLVEGFAPAPVSDAFKTLAMKGRPRAKDITKALEEASATLKP